MPQRPMNGRNSDRWDPICQQLVPRGEAFGGSHNGTCLLKLSVLFIGGCACYQRCSAMLFLGLVHFAHHHVYLIFLTQVCKKAICHQWNLVPSPKCRTHLRPRCRSTSGGPASLSWEFILQIASYLAPSELLDIGDVKHRKSLSEKIMFQLN